jgi:hypothetical protein
MGVIMDEMTLWEIIEGFEISNGMGFTVFKQPKIDGLDGPFGWLAYFGNNHSEVFLTRKEALISAITKLTVQ